MPPRSIPPSKYQRISLDGKNYTILVHCPRCGRRSALDHTVLDTGEVRPSFRCPNDCGFDEYIALGGWKP